MQTSSIEWNGLFEWLILGNYIASMDKLEGLGFPIRFSYSYSSSFVATASASMHSIYTFRSVLLPCATFTANFTLYLILYTLQSVSPKHGQKSQHLPQRYII